MEINLPKKRYYKVGEVAQAFDVNSSLIRYWEKEFDVIKPKKNAKGDRMFTDVDIENFKIIYHLVKDKGYTLDGVRKQFKQDPKETFSKQQIITKLEFVKQELIKIQNQL